MEQGKLYLLPVMLGDTAEGAEVILPFNSRILQDIDEYIVENEKTARRCLKQMGLLRPFNDLIFHSLNRHTDPEEIPTFLKGPLEGRNSGLLSEAGCPAIADPGMDLIRLAHAKNIRVVPLVGPSSVLLALMASGMNGQHFCFCGYLPKEKKERINKLKDLERTAVRLNQTQLFIETPYRNNHVIEDALNNLSPDCNFCIACDLTLPGEFIKTQTIAEWRKQKPDLDNRPAVFLIGK